MNALDSSGLFSTHQSIPTEFPSGIIEFTLILSFPHSTAAALVMDLIASLTAAYIPYPCESGLKPAELAKFTILPPFSKNL